MEMFYLRLVIALGVVLPSVALPVLEQLTDGEIIRDSYIVTLKQDLEAANLENHYQWVSDIHHQSLTRRDTLGVRHSYNIGDFHAYSGEFDEETIDEISKRRDVS